MEKYYIIFGALIGIANIIPGVSGGTMAVVLGVYDKIINAISNLRNNFKNSLKTLIPIGLGAVIGIVAFAKLIEIILAKFPVATNLVFIGLIIGSFKMIIEKSSPKGWNLSGFLALFISLGIMLLIQILNVTETSAITELSVLSFVKIFTASLISAGAMIIPGLSGSFLLLLFGIYTTILTAISSFNIVILIPVGLGCLCGILIFAKIIDKLFKICEGQTYMAILGLMIGSIGVLMPKPSMTIEFFVGVILAMIVAFVTLKFTDK